MVLSHMSTPLLCIEIHFDNQGTLTPDEKKEDIDEKQNS